MVGSIMKNLIQYKDSQIKFLSIISFRTEMDTLSRRDGLASLRSSQRSKAERSRAERSAAKQSKAQRSTA
jgi:hypothetical protein